MFNIRNISIRNKLIFMQVFTSLIVLITFFAVFIISDIKDYKDRKMKSITSLAHVIGTNSASAILFADNETAKEILAELKNVAPEIVYAGITDKKGKPFASYTKVGLDSIVDVHVVNITKTAFTRKQLFVTDDIMSNNEFIGKVSLVVELSELEAIKKRKLEMAAILFVVAILVCFLIAFMVQPYISKRLLYLVNAMSEVRRTGNYSVPITDDGKDEISTLIQVFNKLMLQVKESQQRKDEFIGIASHELKTPLTSIKGYLDLLNVLEDKEPNKQCVERALGSVHKLEELIKDLLDVSKIQSGQLQLNIKDFDIDLLLTETIASLQIVSPTHQIIRENKPGSETVVGDRLRIEQVLINLLSNAIKYSPGQDKVMVSTQQINDEFVIRVRDYGIGIPSDELSEIFERFYRTKDSSVHISGFGLGLYICRDIIQRHHGKIWVEREQKGTSFYFSLPIKQQTKIAYP